MRIDLKFRKKVVMELERQLSALSNLAQALFGECQDDDFSGRASLKVTSDGADGFCLATADGAVSEPLEIATTPRAVVYVDSVNPAIAENEKVAGDITQTLSLSASPDGTSPTAYDLTWKKDEGKTTGIRTEDGGDARRRRLVASAETQPFEVTETTVSASASVADVGAAGWDTSIGILTVDMALAFMYARGTVCSFSFEEDDTAVAREETVAERAVVDSGDEDTDVSQTSDEATEDQG